MPFYVYKCSSCEKITERLDSVSKMKKRVKCECGKMAKRHLDGQSIDVTWSTSGKTPIFYPDHNAVGRARKHKAISWNDNEIRNVSEIIKGKSGVSPYSKMEINPKVLEDEGIAKKVSPKEAEEKRKIAEKVSRDAVSKLSGVEKEHAVRGSGNSGQK